MKRRFDDEDERPNRLWRLTKGVVAGAVVSAAAVAVLSIYVLPPPAPPPAQTGAEAGDPKVVDGIEVSSEPAYSGDRAGSGSDTASADAAGAATDPDLDEIGPIELSGPALAANAEPFDAEPGEPLMAVVLDDTAADPLMHETLFGLGMPLTIGIVAGGAGDRTTARMARDAGYEVVAQLPLVEAGASEGAKLEYGLSRAEASDRTMVLMRRLPMAVAAARPTAAPQPPDSDVLAGIMDALGPLGFAYVAHGLGPDGVPGVASEGLERIVAVSRYTIPSGATAEEAHAVLDRAANAAAEGGGATVVMAKAEEPVLLALQLMGGAGAERLARLAPLSAVIRRQNAGDLPADAELAEPAEVTDTSN